MCQVLGVDTEALSHAGPLSDAALAGREQLLHSKYTKNNAFSVPEKRPSDFNGTNLSEEGHYWFGHHGKMTSVNSLSMQFLIMHRH